MTPLLWSAKLGILSDVEFLTNLGADLNAKNKIVTVFFHNMSSLHWSAQNGHLSVVEYLINKGSDINAKTDLVEK